MQFLKRMNGLMVDPRSNPNANPIFVDSDDEKIKVGTGASGNTLRILGDSVVGYLAPNGSESAPSYSFASSGNSDTGMYFVASGVLGFSGNGSSFAWLYGGNTSAVLALKNDTDSHIEFGASADVSLSRVAAGNLRLGSSTSAQRFDVANTYTSASNNELFSVDWQTAANTALVGTRTAATGSGQALVLVSQFSNGADNYAAVQLSRGGPPFLRVGLRNAVGTWNQSSVLAGNWIQFGEITNTVTSGTNAAVAIIPTYNQTSGTAANTDLLINRTETSVGSGAQNFIEAQVGGNAAFRVSSIGAVYGNITSAIPAGGNTAISFRATSTANFGIFFGSGVPTLSAAKGSLYLRSDGSSTTTRAYINTDGGTTWTAISTVA